MALYNFPATILENIFVMEVCNMKFYHGKLRSYWMW